MLFKVSFLPHSKTEARWKNKKEEGEKKKKQGENILRKRTSRRGNENLRNILKDDHYILKTRKEQEKRESSFRKGF